jgi:hypothetical protein
MKKTIIILATLLLSNCVSIDPKSIIASSGNKPTNQEAISYVKNYLNDTLLDRESLRDLKVKEPFAGSYAFNKGWIICFQYNAKNVMGGYAGSSQDQIIVKNKNASILSSFNQPTNPWLFSQCRSNKWINN